MFQAQNLSGKDKGTYFAQHGGKKGKGRYDLNLYRC